MIKFLAIIGLLILALILVTLRYGRKQQIEKIRREQDAESKRIVEQSGYIDEDVIHMSDSDLDDEL